MSGPGQVTMALPRPGPALKAILIIIGVFGIFQALVSNHTAWGRALGELLVCIPQRVMSGELWRLLTSGIYTSPVSFNHLLFTLMGLYFLSPELERRWGSARFVRFLAISVIVGNIASVAVASLVPGSQQIYFGADAAIAAIAVAWAREFPDTQIRLFFFLPISGRTLLWVTVGYAVLGLIYPSGMAGPAGPAAPFGGIAVGLTLAGTPSALRSLYLKMRLASLRREATDVGRAGPDLRPGAPPRRGRTPAPPLRVVYGGLEEELKKRKPPKDKRYLN